MVSRDRIECAWGPTRGFSDQIVENSKMLWLQAVDSMPIFQLTFGFVWNHLEILDLDGHILGTVEYRSSLSFTKSIFHSKRSPWLPVRTRHSSLPSIRYIRSQSGSMWYSRQSFNVPFNRWSLVTGESFSPLTNSCTMVLSFSKFLCRFLSRLVSLLNKEMKKNNPSVIFHRLWL